MEAIIKLQMATDTFNNWQLINPILRDGEVGFEKGGNNLYERYKVGNGSTRWNDLPYFLINVIGPQGHQGSQGSQGSPGSNGSQGVQGTQGSIGLQGPQGLSGLQGFRGYQGYQGYQGETGLGFTIAKIYNSEAELLADTSPTGIFGGQFALISITDITNPDDGKLYLWNGLSYQYITNISGIPGVQGPQGNQGYGLQGLQGVQGSQGWQGNQGLSGNQGSQGLQGFDGTQGNQGFQGINGTQGPQGYQGNQGVQGYQGSSIQGPQGPSIQGPQGYQGPQGSGTQGTGSGLTISSISTATNAVANYRYICDTSSAAFSLTLPPTPAAGDYIEIIDAKGTFATNNLTVANNTKNINGVAESLIIDIANTFITLTFSNDATRGWQVDIGGNGFPKFSTSTVYSNLVEEKILTVDSSSITFSGLNSSVDGDYYLEANILANATGINNTIILLNGDSSETGYLSVRQYSGTNYNPTKDSTINSAILGSLNANMSWLMNLHIRVLNGIAFINTMSERMEDASDLVLMQHAIRKTAPSITSITLKERANGVGIKAGSTFRLYKSNGAKYLVPYNPTDITSRTSDYPLKAGEVVYRTYTSATSVPLNIATQEGEYEIIINGEVSTGGIDSVNYFSPPNLGTPVNITMSSQNGSTPFAINWATNLVIGEGNVRKALLKISTSTKSKTIHVDSCSKRTATPYQVYLSHWFWEDSSIPWTSLGSIIFTAAQSGKIIIKRIL
jgi:hypothetical protein